MSHAINNAGDGSVTNPKVMLCSDKRKTAFLSGKAYDSVCEPGPAIPQYPPLFLSVCSIVHNTLYIYSPHFITS